ncbi:CoA-binding protein [Candidatus Dojkabacteria bacterium]|nr:CoA-binding protein [Candidatus Dojkabacteria bacterium]
MEKIQAFFAPKSTAVIGVSDDPVKLGSVVFNNMIEAGYEGELYPVNPKYEKLYGYKAYPSIKDIPGDIDLACIVIPAKFVVDVMKECADKGVKAVIIITAGFKEIGEEGKKIEEEVVKIAQEADIRIMGPNCLGVIASGSNVNASFAASRPNAGNLAFMSQSGAFCTAMLDMSIPANLGFSHFVSFGNKADVDEIDLLKYWFEDEDVRVVGAYLEEVKYGRDFLNVVSNSKNKKPVIILKPGQSDEAKKAISSHTGSLAGSIQTFKTAIRQFGVIEAETIREMFNLMMMFSWSNMPKGDRIAVVTNAGGPGIIATDCVVANGMKLAEISDETHRALEEVLPDTASLHNPIDVIGDANAKRYNDSIEILASDPNIDSILVILTPQLVTQIEDTAKIIVNSAKKYNKPIIPVYIGDKYVSAAIQRFYDSKIPCFKDPADAIQSLRTLLDYVEHENNSDENSEKIRNRILSEAGQGKYTDEVKAQITGGEKALEDDLVAKMAEEVGLVLPKQKLCSSVADAVEFSKGLYPVVVKASNAAIAHKTDFKAIYLNVQDASELEEVYGKLEKTILENSDASEAEILVQEMIKFKESVFIGANRDGGADVYGEHNPGFGHLLAVGQGGIYTEIYKDIGYALAPATDDEIKQAFNSTNVSKIVNGARGQDPLAIQEVYDAIMAVQKLLVLYPDIVSLDINPLVVSSDRAVAVDVKVFV